MSVEGVHGQIFAAFSKELKLSLRDDEMVVLLDVANSAIALPDR
jgi:hypothetical protein